MHSDEQEELAAKLKALKVRSLLTAAAAAAAAPADAFESESAFWLHRKLLPAACLLRTNNRCRCPLRDAQVKCITGNQQHDWRPEVTHVVSHTPRRNQKCLAAMAEGGWLVGTSWVEASQEAGRLLAEVRGAQAAVALVLNACL
jgi:hypothetical protein